MVGFFEEFVDERLFVVDFGATDDDEDGFCWVFGSGFEVGDFFFKKEASVNREVILDGIGGSVGAVNHGEAVLDVEVGLGGVDDATYEIGIVGFFAWEETEVFEQ